MFPTTRWTLIQSVKDQNNDNENNDNNNEKNNEAEEKKAKAATEALAQLLQAYWKPLYIYARKTGKDDDKAKDAVQSFAAHVLEKNVFSKAAKDKGSLRSFLKTAFKNFMINEFQKSKAIKRGGEFQHFSFIQNADSLNSSEQFFQNINSFSQQPDQAYEEMWALTVFNNATEKLKQEYIDNNRKGPIDWIILYFNGANTKSYQEMLEESGFSATGFKALIHRAKKKFKEYIYEEISDLVADEKYLNEELQYLLDKMKA